MNLVEANIGGDILEAIRPEIAEEPNFALAIFRLADGDEINPAVVVVVEGGNAPRVNPVRDRQRDGLELPVIVAPQSDGRRSRMGEGEIHPTIVIEVENRDAETEGWHWSRPRLHRIELPIPWVLKKRGRFRTSDNDIDCAIVVKVTSDRSHGGTGAR